MGGYINFIKVNKVFLYKLYLGFSIPLYSKMRFLIRAYLAVLL